MANGQTINFDALAKEHGGAPAAIDFDALAKQHGGATTPNTPSSTVDLHAFQLADILKGPAYVAKHPIDSAKLLGGALFGPPGGTVKPEVSEADLATAPRFAVPGGSTTPIGEGISEAAAASSFGVAGEAMGQPKTSGALKATRQLGGEVVQGGKSFVQDLRASRATRAAAKADRTLVESLGPTKSNPVEVTDVQRARPYIEEEHSTTPITKKNAVEQFREHTDTAIGKIDEKIGEYIKANPTDTIGGHAKPVDAVKAALGKNVRKGFVDEGLKAIEDYPISDEMTVAEADSVRHQLNADNRSAMKAKNNYDLANMRQTDPAFAAREALANSLRDGVYGKLEERGIPGVRELRKDQGALIKLRNAAEARKFQGEAKVAGTESGGKLRRAIGRVTKLGATAKGAAMGGPAGAIVGEELGQAAQNLIAPGRSTRNELLVRAFNKPQTPGSKFPSIPARPAISGELGAGATITPEAGLSVQTPAEITAQSAATAAAQKPNVRVVRDPVTGKMKRQFLTSGGGETLYPEVVKRGTSKPMQQVQGTKESAGAKVLPEMSRGSESKVAQKTSAMSGSELAPESGSIAEFLKKKRAAAVGGKPAKEVYSRYLDEVPSASGLAEGSKLTPEMHAQMEKRAGFKLTDRQARNLYIRSVQEEMLKPGGKIDEISEMRKKKGAQ